MAINSLVWDVLVKHKHNNFFYILARERELLKMALESAFSLPKYVTFRSLETGRFLCARQFEGRPRLQFASTDSNDPTAIMEIIDANDGNLHIKDVASGKFWIMSQPDRPHMIFADADDASNNNRETLFRAFKINNSSIALLSQGSEQFCRRFTDETLTNGFNANSISTGLVERLMVEEPAVSREIFDITYNINESKIYDNETVVLVENSYINRANFSTSAVMILTYKDIQSSTWRTDLLLKLNSKAFFNAAVIPFIVAGNVRLVDQVFELEQNELDEPITKISVTKIAYGSDVPSRSKLIVSLTATKGKCDVPFTFTQRDTLSNGFTYTAQHKGTYTGSCYYDLHFQRRIEPMQTSPSLNEYEGPG